MKNGVFWDVTPCGSCKNRRFEGTYRLHYQGEKRVFLRSVLQFLVTAYIVPRWPNVFTLMIEEIHSSETSVIKRAIRRDFPEDFIVHSHRRERPKAPRQANHKQISTLLFGSAAQASLYLANNMAISKRNN
jgi:hypothetical protein